MKILRPLNPFLGIALVILTLTIIFPGEISLFKKISIFGVHVTLFLLVASMVFLILSERQLMFISLGCTTILCLFLKNEGNLHLLLPKESQDQAISIAHINMNSHQMDVDDLVRYLERLDADIVSLQEFTPIWDRELNENIERIYPYFQKVSRIDPHGIALYSKFELDKTTITYLEEKPCISIQLKLNDAPIKIYTTYITPGLDRMSSRMADKQLNDLASLIHFHQTPCIVLGEFNEVYWSNKMRGFRSMNNLRNSRRDILPTTFSVPFDHIFYSGDIECTFFKDLADESGIKIGIIGKYQLKNSFLNASNSNISSIESEEP